MAKKEKTWVLRGSVKRFKKDFLEGLGSIVSLVIALDSFQSGNAKAYRYEQAKPWLELSSLQGAREKISSLEVYLGEDLVVWVTEVADDEGNKTFSLKRIEEKTMDIMPAEKFLENCI
jgi:hypothetical protein